MLELEPEAERALSIQDSLRQRLSARVLTRAGIAVAVLFALFITVACDSGDLVVVENTTHEIVLVFKEGQLIFGVAPRSSRAFRVRNFEGDLTFEVKSLDLEVLDSVTFTSKEIRESDGIRIRIY